MLSNRENVILITYPEQYVIKEAIALASTAGYNVTNVITQKYLNRSSFGIGKGKLKDLEEMVKNTEVDKILFDETLRPTQAYNLAKILKKEVIDREKLILQIFTKHAVTSEAKLQIKLAEQRYELIRARNKVNLEKKGEQPGFFGLGEYEVEVYVNQIKRQIEYLNIKLADIRKQRETQRAQREENDIPLVSLAGYTGVGKTSIFNLLTGEKLQVSDQIFTTLRTTTRKILNERNILISDTVGFIRNIPPYMIEAFKSTLEELKFADVILLVVDVSEPISEIRKKFSTSLNILYELGVIISDIVVVLNKQDLVSEEKIKEVENQFKNDELEYIIISAKTNYGGNELLEKIRIKLDEVTKEFFVDYQSVALISNFLDWLKQSSRVETRKDQNCLYIKVTGRKTILSQFENQLKRVRADIRT
ncbi:MAG: GTPase HflX [Nitrososphaeria archaeon]|jgi:GTP-binding protein HflX